MVLEIIVIIIVILKTMSRNTFPEPQSDSASYREISCFLLDISQKQPCPPHCFAHAWKLFSSCIFRKNTSLTIMSKLPPNYLITTLKLGQNFWNMFSPVPFTFKMSKPTSKLSKKGPQNVWIVFTLPPPPPWVWACSWIQRFFWNPSLREGLRKLRLSLRKLSAASTSIFEP